MTCDEAKALLNARMDGELDPTGRKAVEEHIETCSSCSQDAERLEHVSRMIRDEFPRSAAPAHLRDSIRLALRGAEYVEKEQPKAASRGTNWKLWGALAAGLLIAALASAPFFIDNRDRRQMLADELLSAHERALVGREMDVVSTDQHTVKPWFNGKLPFSPPVVDLADQGFPLQGGRLDYAGDRPVAALVYRRRLHRIDVFVWPAGNEKPPARFDRNGYHEISWRKNSFAFTCVSDLNVGELNTFVRLLQSK
jgi:anti-sigma factor (TIGR02949 family)